MADGSAGSNWPCQTLAVPRWISTVVPYRITRAGIEGAVQVRCVLQLSKHVDQKRACFSRAGA